MMMKGNKKKQDDYNIIWSDRWEDVYHVCISYKNESIDLYQNGKKIFSRKGLRYVQLKSLENKVKFLHINSTKGIEDAMEKMLDALFGGDDDNSSYSFGFY